MKKVLKIICIILVIIIVTAIIFFAVDYSKVKKQKKPIFCILKSEANDGGTKIYMGLGYKIIDFQTLSGFDDIKIGTWSMDYDDFNNEIKAYEENCNMRATIKAVVVKIDENHLLAMGIENGNELYSIGLQNVKDIELKKEQEIIVYFNGDVMESYPAQLGNIGKIEIVKNKSDVKIPDNIIRFCYNSKDKVQVTINELTNSGIALTISDTNDLQYNYSHNYIINKKVKNENYTNVGQKIGEDTENSIAGFTRNRSRIYLERS